MTKNLQTSPGSEIFRGSAELVCNLRQKPERWAKISWVMNLLTSVDLGSCLIPFSLAALSSGGLVSGSPGSVSGNCMKTR